MRQQRHPLSDQGHQSPDRNWGARTCYNPLSIQRRREEEEEEEEEEKKKKKKKKESHGLSDAGLRNGKRESYQPWNLRHQRDNCGNILFTSLPALHATNYSILPSK
jgi:hypothetical protein